MKKLQETVSLIFGALVLCWIAFYNGFPLVYSDTGTYLESGFTLETPLDRPIMYGLFLRMASLNGLTPWTVIFVQSLLLVWLLRETIRITFPGKNTTVFFVVAVIVLSLFTGLPIVTSELIADIFTPISVLALFALLFGRYTALKTVGLSFLLLLACACHISHVAICFAIAASVGTICFFRFRRKKELLTDVKRISAALIIPLLALLTMVSSISKSRHVFMMGHLVETGILNAYLDDHCPSEEISFCAYRDRIPPGAETFIWNSDGDSALILTGGWLGSKEEYSRIISETFSQWKYVKMHLGAAVSGTFRQLYYIRVGEGLGRYDSTYVVSQRIAKYFPAANNKYLRSRQSNDEFGDSPLIDTTNKIVTSLAVIVIAAWLLMRRNKTNTRIVLALILSTAFAYLLNCGICATLATVANRFGARLSWLAVFVAIMLIYEWISAKRNAEVFNK